MRRRLLDDVLTEDKGECVICLDDLRCGDAIARLPCLCVYHKRWVAEFRERPSPSAPSQYFAELAFDGQWLPVCITGRGTLSPGRRLTADVVEQYPARLHRQSGGLANVGITGPALRRYGDRCTRVNYKDRSPVRGRYCVVLYASVYLSVCLCLSAAASVRSW